jgi:ribose 1,5-bisphosphokinase PhnN
VIAGTEIVAYKRWQADGTALDMFTWPMGPNGCKALAAIWTARLQSGRYSRIELRMANGQTVVVKAKRAKVPHVEGVYIGDMPYHEWLDTLQPRPEAGDAT